ncbi:DUF4198 domain-containing protein [Marinomonas sp. A79]|uniref:DUF4198 domain-containing protein n=1 Tax=Marinomonas vulgaris TaxID=2823372 RepID=A0ABS5HDN9_9GAMM|nr:DUF4198 domain-containing protein [Marinomonas vulgaris]MBR7889767.1 DUF4198 domain-containing protein [Marinomonas vulgaris]
MLKLSLCALGIVAASSSFAHDLMIMPAKSIVTKAPADVAVDISASHGVYRYDKAVSVDGIMVYGPDGKHMRDIGTVVKSATRTSFDLAIETDGTYKIVYGSSRGGYMTTYTIGARDTHKRERLSKSELAGKIPEGAKNVETIKMNRYSMAFITSKMPTDAVITPSNKGFEVIPVTHPADYVNGEEIALKVLMNGKPVEGVSIAIKSESGIYTGNQEPIKLSTNKAGIASVTLEEAGRYSAMFNYEAASQDPEADKEVNSVFYSFEVVYE